MSSTTTRYLLAETLAPGTRYVGLPLPRNGAGGFSAGSFISWATAAYAATFFLEVTSLDPIDAPINATGANQWKDSGVTIAAATGAGVGASMVNVENLRQLRARLRIVTTAAGDVKVANGTP